MTIFLVSSLTDGQHLTFDPFIDQLMFDAPSADAAALRIDASTADLRLSLGGISLFLDGLTAGNLSSANLTFANGSVLHVGDGLASTPGDGTTLLLDLSADPHNNQVLCLSPSADITLGSGDDHITGGTTRTGLAHVSQAGGTGAPTASFGPSVSADGRYVLFMGGWTGFGSQANSSTDVLVRDMVTGTFSNEHLSSSGAFGLSGSGSGEISADGSTAVFNSTSSLVPNGPLFMSVYAADIGSLAIEVVSTTAAGAYGNGASFDADPSGDGRYVVFTSTATNFAAGGNSTVTDLFLKDRQTGSLTRVSTDLTGGDADSDCVNAQISTDGRYVVFASAATDLSAVRTGNGKLDVYLWDRTTAALTNLTGSLPGDQSSSNADVTSSGFVVFQTGKALVAGDTNLATDIYRYDLSNQTYQLVSTRADGSVTSGGGQDAAISDDGRFVVFRSFAADLVPGDTNGFADIFLKDMTTGAVALITAPAQGNGHASGRPQISAGGGWIVFESSASNLTGTDANGGATDIFRIANPFLSSTFRGGAGDDLYDLTNPATIVERLNEGTDTVRTAASYRLGANLENLELTGGANRFAKGNGLNNILTGNAGDNLIDGFSGTDTASYATARAAVTVSLLVSGVQATGAGSDTLQNIENLTGSKFNDRLTGDAGANVLDGGAGNDTMTGGEGGDSYIADSSADIVVETGLTAGDTDWIFAGVNWTLGARLENLTLTGSAIVGNGNNSANLVTGNAQANSLSGAAGDDTLNGGAANDSLSGGAGNDTMNGGAGNDTMTGGEGSDTYICDSSADIVTEAGITVGDRDEVRAGVNWTLGSTLENLTLTGSAALVGNGNAQANVLTGNSAANSLNGFGGDDTLSGGGGNDSLTGSTGNDTLTGGAGADAFLFNATTGADSVTDFTSGTDVLRLSQISFAFGDADQFIEGAVLRAAPGGFATSAELVIFTSNLANLSTATVAAAIGSATSAYTTGQHVLFAADTGTGTALYSFTSSGTDALVTAAELSLIATLTTTAATTLADYFWTP